MPRIPIPQQKQFRRKYEASQSKSVFFQGDPCLVENTIDSLATQGHVLDWGRIVKIGSIALFKPGRYGCLGCLNIDASGEGMGAAGFCAHLEGKTNLRHWLRGF